MRMENRKHHREQHGVTAGALTGFDGPVGLLPPPLTESFSTCGSFILVTHLLPRPLHRLLECVVLRLRMSRWHCSILQPERLKETWTYLWKVFFRAGWKNIRALTLSPMKLHCSSEVFNATNINWHLFKLIETILINLLKLDGCNFFPNSQIVLRECSHRVVYNSASWHSLCM